MSRCIKTGAMIRIVERNEYFWCDIHAYEDVLIFNLAGDHNSGEHRENDQSHYADVIIGDGYYGESKNVIVVKAYNVTFVPKGTPVSTS